uniref:Uncharacterized protein n=2 Tax=unclassified Mycobacterium TaxID=2642494 RepID=A1UJQ8_MYCSK
MDKKQATVYDKEIRRLVGKIQDDLDTLAHLINQMLEGQAHLALGFKTPQAYLQDVFRIDGVSRVIEQRRPVVAMLTQKGLSQRAIADIVGVSVGTVVNDQAASGAQKLSTSSEDRVIGRDGKSYPATKPKPEPEVSDDEIIDYQAAQDDFNRLTSSMFAAKRKAQDALSLALHLRGFNEDEKRSIVADVADEVIDVFNAIKDAAKGRSMDAELRKLLDQG